MRQPAIVKSHAEMTKFLERLVRHSDRIYGNLRAPAANKHYDEAVKLIAKAKALLKDKRA